MTIVATISALKSVTVSGLPSNELAYVAGYYSAYDGGGGFFSYSSASSAADNGGTTIAPTSGSGRWLRVVESDLNVLWFGALGDGATDNSSTFQNVINAALAIEATIYVPAGRFKIGNSLLANGALRIRGDGYSSVIDGSGNYYSGDSSKDVGFGITVASQLGTTAYTSTGNLYAGTTSLALNSVSGLSVGSDIYLELGVSASDSSQPFYRMFAKVTAIAGTTITLDNGVPEDINGTSHNLWLNLVPARNVSITNLRFHNFHFSLNKMENGVVADLYFDSTNSCFLVTNCYNTAFNRVYVEVLQGLANIGIASMYGWVIQGWGMYNVTAHDIRVRNLRGVPFFSCEAESRQVFMNEIHLGLADAVGNTQQIPVFASAGISSPRPIHVRDLYINVLASSNIFNCAIGSVFYTNVYITGNGTAGSAYSQPPFILLPLAQVAGTLYYKNQTYFLRKQFRRLIHVAPGTGASFYDLGVKGLLTQLRLFASNLTGISFVGHSNTSASGDNLLSSLTTNQFSGPLVTSTYIGVGNPSYFSDDVILQTTTDGTQSPVAYLVAEGEALVSPTDAELAPETLIGGAAPSTSAAFVGQYFLDVVNDILYYAKTVGSGASDWLALN